VEIECSPCDLGTTVIAATKALSLKSAFSRLPLVHRADLEGRQRADSCLSWSAVGGLVPAPKQTYANRDTNDTASAISYGMASAGRLVDLIELGKRK